MTFPSVFFVSLVIIGLPPAGADDPPEAPCETITLRRCVLEFERSTLLGTATTGVLQDCLVKPGDKVVAGQVLGRLHDQDLRAELELRAVESENDIDIRLNDAKHSQAMSKLKASESLIRRNLVSAEEFTTHRLEEQAAALGIEEAKHRRRIARMARRHVEEMIRAREITAPHDGIVVAVLKGPGESVALNDPVFRIVAADRIRVTGFLDVADSWRARADQVVRVLAEIPGVELPIEKEVFVGKVQYVDSEVNPENQTCRVVALVVNRNGLLRAGLPARMEIVIRDQPGTPAPTKDERK